MKKVVKQNILGDNALPVAYPLFIFDEGNDLSVIRDEKSIYGEIEPVDVNNILFTAYDAKGRLINLVPTGEYCIKPYLAENEPLHADELKGKLFGYAKTFCEPINENDTQSLDVLIEIIMNHEEKTKSLFSRNISEVLKIIRQKKA
jgi:hypothetical protein